MLSVVLYCSVALGETHLSLAGGPTLSELKAAAMKAVKEEERRTEVKAISDEELFELIDSIEPVDTDDEGGDAADLNQEAIREEPTEVVDVDDSNLDEVPEVINEILVESEITEVPVPKKAVEVKEEAVKDEEVDVQEPVYDYYVYVASYDCPPCDRMLNEIRSRIPSRSKLHILEGFRKSRRGTAIQAYPYVEILEGEDCVYQGTGYRSWDAVHGEINK